MLPGARSAALSFLTYPVSLCPSQQVWHRSGFRRHKSCVSLIFIPVSDLKKTCAHRGVRTAAVISSTMVQAACWGPRHAVEGEGLPSLCLWSPFLTGVALKSSSRVPAVLLFMQLLGPCILGRGEAVQMLPLRWCSWWMLRVPTSASLGHALA